MIHLLSYFVTLFIPHEFFYYEVLLLLLFTLKRILQYPALDGAVIAARLKRLVKQILESDRYSVIFMTK